MTSRVSWKGDKGEEYEAEKEKQRKTIDTLNDKIIRIHFFFLNIHLEIKYFNIIISKQLFSLFRL